MIRERERGPERGGASVIDRTFDQSADKTERRRGYSKFKIFDQ